MHRTLEVCLHGRAYTLFGRRLNDTDTVDARIVDHDIEAPELLENGRKSLIHGIVPDEIER